jgi:hypothetical protein
MKTQIKQSYILGTNLRNVRRVAKERGYALYMKANSDIVFFYVVAHKLRQKTYKKGSYKLI